MRIQVHITIRSDEGKAEVVHEVAHLEHGPLRADTLGLSLAEARSILAGLERMMAEGQAAEFVAQAQRCASCGQLCACKGHHPIVFRTPFGKLKLDSPPAVPLPVRGARDEERQSPGGMTSRTHLDGAPAGAASGRTARE